MKIIIILIMIAIALAGIILLIKDDGQANQACVNDKCFKLEIADNVEERKIGLMEHESLGQDEGMLFIFKDDSLHSIWMKNMKFPIDIIWIDNNYNVVYVEENAQPCLDSCSIYVPSKAARYVLEVNTGSNIKPGDKIELK